MTKKLQPIWESSGRPLYPKYIWVKNIGLRHFILDHDIAQRAFNDNNSGGGSSSGGHKKPATVWYHDHHPPCDVMRDELDNLHLIGSADVLSERRASNSSDHSQNSGGNVRLCRKHASGNNLHKLKKRLNTQSVGKSLETKECDAEKQQQQQQNCTGNSEQDILQTEINKNKLTERVLQWLDLAGRSTIVRRVEEPTLPRRIHTTESTTTKPQQRLLRRTESVHHLSILFNPDNNNEVDVAKNGAFFDSECRRDARLGSIFQLPHRASANKFMAHSAQGRCASSVVHQCEEGEVESMGQNSAAVGGVSEKRAKPKRHDSAIETQYRQMVQRQILETSCNMQNAKKQLHIFMPNMPDKKGATGQQSAGMADCESCLSTIIGSDLTNPGN